MNGMNEMNEIGRGYGARADQTVGNIKSVSTVARALTDLGTQLGEVEMAAERLGDKLGPVLSGDADKDATGNPYPPVNCEMEDRIQHLTRRAEVLMRQLSRLADRLCV